MPDKFDQIEAELATEAPAPEAAPSAEPTINTDGSTAAAAPTPEPEALVAPPPAASQEPPYMRVLADQNRTLTDKLQQTLDNQQKMIDMALQKAQPELTAAQREEIRKAAFFEFNKDPEAFVNGKVQAAVEAVKKEMADKLAGFAPLTQEMQVNSAVKGMLDRASAGRPEIANPAFQLKMLSKEVTDKVYKDHFAGQDPINVIKDPTFYVEAYHVARQLQAAAPAVAAQRQQSETDMQSQRQVLQGHGTAQAGGGAPQGKRAPADPNADIKAAIRSTGSAQDMLLDAFRPKK